MTRFMQGGQRTVLLDLDEIFVHLLNRSKEETGGNKHASFTG
jgi:hypothetical protein